MNVECNGDTLSQLPCLQKLKCVCGPARFLLFLRDKFVFMGQLRRFRKSKKFSLAASKDQKFNKT